jgi:hypothetical protein
MGLYGIGFPTKKNMEQISVVKIFPHLGSKMKNSALEISAQIGDRSWLSTGFDNQPELDEIITEDLWHWIHEYPPK